MSRTEPLDHARVAEAQDAFRTMIKAMHLKSPEAMSAFIKLLAEAGAMVLVESHGRPDLSEEFYNLCYTRVHGGMMRASSQAIELVVARVPAEPDLTKLH